MRMNKKKMIRDCIGKKMSDRQETVEWMLYNSTRWHPIDQASRRLKSVSSLRDFWPRHREIPKIQPRVCIQRACFEGKKCLNCIRAPTEEKGDARRALGSK